MICRFFVAVCVVSVLVLYGQMPSAAQTESKDWTVPRMPWGDPDMEGVWSFATITPLERPTNLAARVELTDDEVAEVNRDARVRNDRRPQAGSTGTYNAFWWDRGESTGRTSLIMDPPDGRIPSLTEEGKARVASRDDRRMRRAEPRSWEDRPLAERCIQYRPLPRLPTGYNNHYQIFQTADSVVLLTEMIHNVRVIPLDERSHIDSRIRLWNGDSRGRWEGNTLVVETTNFSNKTSFRGAGADLHLTERFTRTAPDQIAWEFTVEDSTTWTRPWSGGIPFKQVTGPLYEYACHEGNYAMPTMLRGSRIDTSAGTGTSSRSR